MIEKIELPEVLVTPTPKPADNLTAGQGGAEEPDLASGIKAHDILATARVQGHSWEDIHQFNSNFEALAQDNGYSKEDANTHLGWPDVTPFQARSNFQWRERTQTDEGLKTALKAPEGEEESKLSTNKLSGDWLQADYAKALAEGHVKSPEDFAQQYLAELAQVSGNTSVEDQAHTQKLATELAKGLPSLENTIDYSIALSRANSHNAVTPKSVGETKDNLLDLWAQTKILPKEVFNSENPLLQDAVSQPPIPNQPTLKDLEALGKDAIYDPIPQLPKFISDFFKGLTEGALLPAEDVKTELDKGAGVSEIAGATAGRIPVGLMLDALRSAAKEVEAAMTGEPLSGEGMLGAGMMGLGVAPKGSLGSGFSLGRKPPELPLAEQKLRVAAAVNALGKKRPPKPLLPETRPEIGPIDPKELKALTGKLDDKLYSLRGNAQADKIEIGKLVNTLPAEWRNKGFQEKASELLEERLLGPKKSEPLEFSQYLDTIKPLTDRQTQLGETIQTKIHGTIWDDPGLSVKNVNKGIIHRVIKGTENDRDLVDPNIENRDVILGGKGSLTKFSASLRGQTHYVLERNGVRIWGSTPLNSLQFKDKGGKTVQFGDKITSGYDKSGKDLEWEVKPASMKEIEENATDADGKPITFYKNHLGNLVDDVTRLERINRNLDFLESTRQELMAKDLFYPKESNSPIPRNAIRVELPGLDGFAHPKVANLLNDFHSEFKSDLDGWLTRVNRAIVSTLFISPIVHIGNVGAHWYVGRGWDWIKPAGYGSLMKDGLAAIKEVYTLGPRYVEHLREGSGLQYASTQTENFYTTVMHQVFHEIMRDEKTWGTYAKAFGMLPVDLVKGMYSFSRKALWSVNDIFLLQRQFELERRGIPMQEAIKQAEIDIPNYRIPNEVMGSHVMGQFLRSPNGMVFGRYRYGQMKALSMMVKDLVGKGENAGDFKAAVGKATMLGLLALVVYPLLNNGLQSLTGNPKAEVKPFGPFTPISAVSGLIEGQKNWLGMTGSFISLAPALDILYKLTTNKDKFGKDVISWHGTTPTGKGFEALEASLSEIYPGQLLLDGLRYGKEGLIKDAGGLLGANIPPHKKHSDPYYEKMNRKEGQRRERNDLFEKWFKDHFPGKF